MNDKTKIIIAAACLLIAGVVVAMQMGLFGSSGPKGVANTEEFEANLDEAERLDNTTGTVVIPAEPGGRAGLSAGN